MKPIQALVRLQFSDIKFSMFIFWSILMSIFAVMALVLSYFPEGSVTQGGFTAVYIYSFVTGIVLLNETIKFSLGMNIRRKDYYTSSMITFVTLSLLLSTIITVLSKFEAWISDQWTIHLAMFRSPFIHAASPSFQTNTIASEWITHFVIIIFILSFGYLLSTINYRFGKTGMFTLSTLILLFILLMSIFQLWGSLAGPLSTIDSLWKLLMLISCVAVIFSGICYGLLLRAVIKT